MEGDVYLGRRQEVGPEGGSGRLQGEHGAAASSPRPGRNPGPAAGQRQRRRLPTPASSELPARPPRPRLLPAGPGGPTGGTTAERPPERGGAGDKSGRLGRPGPSPEGAPCPAPRDGGRRAGGRPLSASGPRRRRTRGLGGAPAAGPQRGSLRERSSVAILRMQPWEDASTAAHGGQSGPRESTAARRGHCDPYGSPRGPRRPRDLANDLLRLPSGPSLPGTAPLTAACLVT